jgi:CheY-like chemotaxis protein
MMHGRIWAESEQHRGSRFQFTICAEAAGTLPLYSSTSPASSPPAPGRLSALRILVAEDNRINQVLIARLLENAGASVTLAADGAEVVRLFQDHPFDAILMDIQMPTVDGLEAATRVRALEAAGLSRRPGHTPVLALTAHAMQGDRERFLSAGMDGYISKPIDTASLLAELARVLELPPSIEPLVESLRAQPQHDYTESPQRA